MNPFREIVPKTQEKVPYSRWINILLILMSLFVEIAHAQDPCSPNPCQNMGVCQTSGSGFQCECSLESGFTGELCTIPPARPTVINSNDVLVGDIATSVTPFETSGLGNRTCFPIPLNATSCIFPILDVGFYHLMYVLSECKTIFGFHFFFDVMNRKVTPLGFSFTAPTGFTGNILTECLTFNQSGFYYVIIRVPNLDCTSDENCIPDCFPDDNSSGSSTVPLYVVIILSIIIGLLAIGTLVYLYLQNEKFKEDQMKSHPSHAHFQSQHIKAPKISSIPKNKSVPPERVMGVSGHQSKKPPTLLSIALLAIFYCANVNAQNTGSGGGSGGDDPTVVVDSSQVTDDIYTILRSAPFIAAVSVIGAMTIACFIGTIVFWCCVIKRMPPEGYFDEEPTNGYAKKSLLVKKTKKHLKSCNQKDCPGCCDEYLGVSPPQKPNPNEDPAEEKEPSNPDSNEPSKNPDDDDDDDSEKDPEKGDGSDNDENGDEKEEPKPRCNKCTQCCLAFRIKCAQNRACRCCEPSVPKPSAKQKAKNLKMNTRKQEAQMNAQNQAILQQMAEQQPTHTVSDTRNQFPKTAIRDHRSLSMNLSTVSGGIGVIGGSGIHGPVAMSMSENKQSRSTMTSQETPMKKHPQVVKNNQRLSSF